MGEGGPEGLENNVRTRVRRIRTPTFTILRALQCSNVLHMRTHPAQHAGGRLTLPVTLIGSCYSTHWDHDSQRGRSDEKRRQVSTPLRNGGAVGRFWARPSCAVDVPEQPARQSFQRHGQRQDLAGADPSRAMMEPARQLHAHCTQSRRLSLQRIVARHLSQVVQEHGLDLLQGQAVLR